MFILPGIQDKHDSIQSMQKSSLYHRHKSTLFRPSSGKCSHGGAADLTSSAVPRGGINKDERRTDNAAFHDAAVKAATDASLQLLDDIRLAVGNNEFLRYAVQIEKK